MSGLSLWGADLFSRNLFGRTQPVLDSYYLALITGNAPSSFVSGEEISEVSSDGTGYERVQIANIDLSWSQDDYTTTTNALDLVFPTASTAWGKVDYWALCNTPVSGHLVFYGAFTNSYQVNAGDIFQVSAGTLQITLPTGN